MFAENPPRQRWLFIPKAVIACPRSRIEINEVLCAADGLVGMSHDHSGDTVIREDATSSRIKVLGFVGGVPRFQGKRAGIFTEQRLILFADIFNYMGVHRQEID